MDSDAALSDAPELSLAGKTQEWKFNDGPTAGKIYRHMFRPDGTVAYHEVGGKHGMVVPAAKTTPRTKYASFDVGDHRHLVSYLSDGGFTLTVLVNLEDRQLAGFASNETEWHPVTGTLLS